MTAGESGAAWLAFRRGSGCFDGCRLDAPLMAGSTQILQVFSATTAVFADLRSSNPDVLELWVG